MALGLAGWELGDIRPANFNYVYVPFSILGIDITSKLQAYLNAGKLIWLARGGIYQISSALVATVNGSGLISDGSATIYMPAANFNNTSLLLADRYGANAVGIYAHGALTGSFAALDTFILKGVKFLSEVADGRYVSATALINIKNLVVEECEMSGFPLGIGIRAATLSGHSRITKNDIHDFYSDSVWPTLPQSTGIEIDNDIANGVVSYGAEISSNRVKDIIVGPVIQAAWGYQTDGINLVGKGICRLRIVRNHLENVGEGIDNFSKESIISENEIVNAGYYGIKLIHGASNCEVSTNLVDGAGLSCAIVSPGTADSLNNHLHGNTLINVDPNFIMGLGGSGGVVSSGGSGTGCIHIIDTGTGFHVKDTLVTDNYLDPGTYGRFVFVFDTGSIGTVARNNKEAKKGTVGYMQGGGDVIIVPAKPTMLRVYPNTAQSFSNALGNQVILFDTVEKDARSEWDNTNHRLVLDSSGVFGFSMRIRFATFSSGAECQLFIRVNGSLKAGWHNKVGTAGEQVFSFSGDVAAVAGDYIDATMTITDASTENITNNAVYSHLSIWQIA